MKEPDDHCDLSSPLGKVYSDIDQRVFAIVEERPSWPCRKGCDHCCRHLAQVPELTAAEWELLVQGIAGLDQATRAQIAQRLSAVAAQSAQSEVGIVCPLLDVADGACRVYLQRPAACRMYGFYMSRDAKLVV